MLLKRIVNRFSNVLSLNSTNLLQSNQLSINLKSNISNFILKSNLSNKFLNVSKQVSFSTSSVRSDLMEFFDDKKNWTEEKVKHGRPWRIDELRLKSNTELHKLWYVLHKERNMLLTMEEAYRVKGMPMPSHERIAKVDESMENLLHTVEERNIAYNLLETGETKKKLNYRRYNSFGYIQYYRPREYLVPWFMNKMWKLKYHYKKIPYWSKFYTSVNRVRLRKERRKIINKVIYFTNRVLDKYPEYEKDKQFIREYFEKKYGYNPPLPYHELIRKPAPNELPRYFKERIKSSKQTPKFPDDEF